MFRSKLFFLSTLRVVSMLAAPLCGCTLTPEVADPCPRFVTEVVGTRWGPGQSHGQDRMPGIVLGPPQGGGAKQGSLDVVSLGNGGEIVVGFDADIVDGPGPDFLVFENAFEWGDGVYAELATVSVSADGIDWFDYPCDASGPPYGDCAGHHPVLHDGAAPPEVPASGGDPFDLAAVGLERARYVRIVDRPDLDGPDGVFDLDAVGIVNAACP